mmetsp:Transcript_109798/g.283743  ORF Transcript_109798/g.283743 Transcript_109798/m.283743 type:complete len:207 (+) Transcript_109798:222-842(+)
MVRARGRRPTGQHGPAGRRQAPRLLGHGADPGAHELGAPEGAFRREPGGALRASGNECLSGVLRILRCTDHLQAKHALRMTGVHSLQAACLGTSPFHTAGAILPLIQQRLHGASVGSGHLVGVQLSYARGIGLCELPRCASLRRPAADLAAAAWCHWRAPCIDEREASGPSELNFIRRHTPPSSPTKGGFVLMTPSMRHDAEAMLA